MGSNASRARAAHPALPCLKEAETRWMQNFVADFSQRDTLIKHDGHDVTIHSVEVSDPGSDTAKPPLVFLPGYGTGAAIFARCWSQLLLRERLPLIAVDVLGSFLSSHPTWTPGTDVEKAEAWFVESLEAWRRAREIPQLDLLGHSIGGNIAAAYAESYPESVRSLILVSPAGLVGEPEDYQTKLRSASRRIRLVMSLWRRGWTPFTAIRLLPKSYARRICLWNARRWSGHRARDPVEETDPEVVALADYIYHGWQEGPASADVAIAALLHPGAWGKKPLGARLPKISVSRLEIIYGTRDWMDMRHGNRVAEACAEQRTSEQAAPLVCVQVVEGAGHYAHLENVDGFVEALSCALKPRSEGVCVTAPLPDGYEEQFTGPRIPAWRSWEGYSFGR